MIALSIQATEHGSREDFVVMEFLQFRVRTESERSSSD